MKILAAVLLCGSVVAFAFFLYTLINLGKLGIGLSHPRVLVEAGLGVIFLAAGSLMLVLSK